MPFCGLLWSNKIVPFNDETQKGKPPEPKKFDWGELALNALAGLAVVASVSLIVLSFGTATAPMLALAVAVGGSI